MRWCLQHQRDSISEERNESGPYSEQTGKYFPLVEPSDKAIKAIKQKIQFYTRRDMNPVPIEGIVGKLNRKTRKKPGSESNCF